MSSPAPSAHRGQTQEADDEDEEGGEDMEGLDEIFCAADSHFFQSQAKPKSSKSTLADVEIAVSGSEVTT
jgi:hypothetical protein